MWRLLNNKILTWDRMQGRVLQGLKCKKNLGGLEKGMFGLVCVGRSIPFPVNGTEVGGVRSTKNEDYLRVSLTNERTMCGKGHMGPS